MNSSSLITYSRQLNLDCARSTNSRYFRDFSKNKPSQELTKFSKANFFQEPQYATRNQDEVDIAYIVKKFAADSKEISPEHYALTNFLIARGIEAATSHEMESNLVVSEEADRKFKGCTIKIENPFNLVIFANQTKTTMQSFNIQLAYVITVTEKNGANNCYKLNSDGKLEKIDPQVLLQMERMLNELQSQLLQSEEYKKHHRYLSKEADQLTVAKTIQTIIEEKLGFHAISFSCGKSTLTGVTEQIRHSQLPLQLFPCSKKASTTTHNLVDYNKLPELPRSGGVYFEQNEFVMGTNIKDIAVNPELVKKNMDWMTEAEKAEIPVKNSSWTDAVINAVKNLIRTIGEIIAKITSGVTCSVPTLAENSIGVDYDDIDLERRYAFGR